MNYRLRSNQYTHKAWDLEQKGRRSEALAKARQAVSQDPTNTSARHTLAMLLLREGKYSEAERELTTIIALNPHHSASWEDLGGLYLYLGRLADYEILMQRLEQEAPENLVLRIQFGHYLLLNRRFPEAERYLQHVLLEDPHSIKAHWYLGLVHQARGRLGWAIREFREALRSDFVDKNIVLDLSTAYLEIGENEKALQLLKKLRFDYPHDPEVNSLLASTMLDLGKEQEAFEILYHLKARYSQDAMSYVYLAEA
jgi:predicted Zn-dependent protease